MNFEPLFNRVLVKQADISTNGIQLPDHLKMDEFSGEVVAVGKGYRKENGEVIPMDVKVGDKIAIKQGQKIRVGGEEYVIVNEADILGVYRLKLN